jgi:hypothetical protein
MSTPRLHDWLAVGQKHVRYRLNRFWTLPFRLNLASNRSIYVAYQPDSHAGFRHHGEYEALLQRFTCQNRLNNGGDVARLWSFILNIKQVLDGAVAGDFAELGVWRGNTAAVLAHFAHGCGRKVHLFDTFGGFDSRDLTGIDAGKSAEFADTSVQMVRDVIGPAASACDFVRGHFPDSIQDVHRQARYAVVSLDCDLYEPMRAGLRFFYPRMASGGLLIIHDYSNPSWNGARRAVDEFCSETGEYPVLMPDKSGSALIRKSRVLGACEPAAGDALRSAF